MVAALQIESYQAEGSGFVRGLERMDWRVSDRAMSKPLSPSFLPQQIKYVLWLRSDKFQIDVSSERL